MTKPIDNSVVESISRILADILTGSKITTMFKILQLSDFDTLNNRPYTSTKWIRINESILDRCHKTKSAKPFFQVIEYVMKPQDFISQPDGYWHSCLKQINSQLIFYGYELNDAGKIHKIQIVETFSDAKKRLISFKEKLSLYEIHPKIYEYCREELFRENYFHAIFEASKGILNRVRQISELDSDGNSLIDQAFRSKQPLILIRGNLLQTLTEKSEYSGLKSLLNTIVYMYRNPQAHEPKLYNPKSETDAITAFTLMSLAHRILDNCINVRELN
ncbi:MAG: TIGR02391 family protein [Enterococcaceae bacterium]|jgi:uncharacterized protein (TIGR02391 family)|nr:TIGR02391 family protein [Enterococcaceae bacterium]